MTDDELAFVIGHEYAHIEQEHRAKKVASADAKLDALRQGLSEMDNHLREKGSGKIKRAAAQLVGGALGGAGVALSARLESQHYETKADERGIEVAAAAGYDPEASVTAHKKLHGGRILEIGLVQSITSSHPAPRARHEHLNQKSKSHGESE